MTLFLDDDWLVGASPRVVHTPNGVMPLNTVPHIYFRGVGFMTSGHLLLYLAISIACLFSPQPETDSLAPVRVLVKEAAIPLQCMG